ncbi:uncharacterized protein V6R79_016955 [Siganus canaliculatus]
MILVETKPTLKYFLARSEKSFVNSMKTGKSCCCCFVASFLLSIDDILQLSSSDIPQKQRETSQRNWAEIPLHRRRNEKQLRQSGLLGLPPSGALSARTPPVKYETWNVRGEACNGACCRVSIMNALKRKRRRGGGRGLPVNLTLSLAACQEAFPDTVPINPKYGIQSFLLLLADVRTVQIFPSST